MIEYYVKKKKGNLDKISNLVSNSWVRVVNPNDKEINFLIEKFRLDKDSLFDGLDQNEVPRLEDEDKIAYIYLRVPTSRVQNESTSSFLVIITKNNFITVSRYDLEIFEKLAASKYFFTDKRERSLLQLLFYVFRAYSLNVRRIIKEVKKDRRNIRKLREKDIFDLVLQEDILNDYLSGFSPLIDMYNKILKTKSLKFKEDEKDFIEDLVVDLNQTFNTCKTSLKTITNMRGYYSTTLTNNLNRIITVLTVFTIFLTIPTLISSIYGMNIPLPLQNYHSIFLLLIGIVFLTWVIVFIGFKRWKII